MPAGTILPLLISRNRVLLQFNAKLALGNGSILPAIPGEARAPTNSLAGQWRDTSGFPIEFVSVGGNGYAVTYNWGGTTTWSGEWDGSRFSGTWQLRVGNHSSSGPVELVLQGDNLVGEEKNPSGRVKHAWTLTRKQ
ncbi:MAG: hypothetical protein JOZ22_13475 [Acidobacteriia bacterium]|nr:hypothetical protein [Terriglobia bacterium]